MKNLNSILLLSFILIAINSSTLYADSFSKNQYINLFEITSGIDTQKESLTTFDKNRTITGKAAKGTNLTIEVYQKLTSKNGEDVYREAYKYSLTVGPSGYFTQNIDLLLGENIIVISSTKNKMTYSLTTTIKRKKNEIKLELEDNIALPGSRK